VFGNSEERLARNALRALETYDGLPDGEGAVHRWIVPARRAARIELEAGPAFVWSQGIRQPAATIVLPPSLEGEEVEWLRGMNGAEVRHRQAGGRILVTVLGPADTGSIEVEGQLTDGTIFTATLSGEMLLETRDEGRQDDLLPDDSVQLYPNPFLTSLNINLRIFDSALAEESAGSSSVRIYDVRGRLVRTILEQGSIHPGDYLHTWDGFDEYGKEAAPGVYYVKLQIGDRSVTKRVILLR
ncbi:MAG TPA: T9SS type A sorting domain-containing protein, partial [Candidatus Eisenbacteria bacterium]|nr:T9SS type A sorting domain-containing protein [Candidatus Eisenbacteria bacterium]